MLRQFIILLIKNSPPTLPQMPASDALQYEDLLITKDHV